ncbi:MAG: AtpZ/AtpI family protein [Bacillota bacterium]
MGGEGWEVLRYLGLITQLGLTVALSAVGGIALGVSLDRRLGTRFLGPLLLLGGLGLGFVYAYRLILQASRGGRSRS